MSHSSPDMIPITQSNSELDICNLSADRTDDLQSDDSAVDLPPSPVLERPSKAARTHIDTPNVKPPSPLLDPPRLRSITIGLDSLMVTPRKDNSCGSLLDIRTDSPHAIGRKSSPVTIPRSKLSGGFIFSRQVTDTLKQLLEMLVQEVGLEESRYTLELIIYIFRNCQSHSVDEKYNRIPLIGETFYKRVWQYHFGRQFMMQCQWTIMEDLLVLSLGFDLSKPFQFLERKLDTVCHKLASLALAGEGKKSKKFHQKELRFFEKEIYDAIPSLKNIPCDLNTSFTEPKSDVIPLTSFPQVWTQSPPAMRVIRKSVDLTPSQSNAIIPLQIRPSPFQILSNSVTSPLEQVTTPFSKSPSSPPKRPSSPLRSTISLGSPTQEFLSLDSPGMKSEVFMTPNASPNRPTSPISSVTTTTTLYNIPTPSNNNITTSTPLIPKLVSVRQTAVLSISDQSLSLPDNSDESAHVTADKVGLISPPDSFMDITLPDNSAPIQDIRGNREAEQQLIQKVASTKQMWKETEKKNEQVSSQRISISSPAGHVVAVMPSKLEFPKLKQCSSGSESSSPRTTPNSSPPPWVHEAKLRNQGSTPSSSPVTSHKRRETSDEQQTYDIRDREVEKSVSKKTANTRLMWLQNESKATTKETRPGSAATSGDAQTLIQSKPERPSSAANAKSKWSLRESTSTPEIVKGSDPLDKRGLHEDEKMLLEKNLTQKIAMKI